MTLFFLIFNSSLFGSHEHSNNLVSLWEFLTNTGNKYNNNFFFFIWTGNIALGYRTDLPSSAVLRHWAIFPVTDQKAVIIVSNYVNTQYPSDYILPLSRLQSNEHMSYNLLRNSLSIQGLKHGHLNHFSEDVI